MTGHNLDALELTVETWMEDAMCVDRLLGAHDTDNLPSPRQPVKHRNAARKLCQGCTVLDKCAGYALRTRAIGVVLAGVPLRLQRNDNLYAELRALAGSEYA